MSKDIVSSNMDELTKEDWPLLKELESTRFSLKNKKKNQKQTLSSIKEQSDLEDVTVATRNAEDDKLVEAFLETRAQEEVSFSSGNKPKSSAKIKGELINENSEFKTINDESFVEAATINQVPPGHRQITINTETPKLIAMGLVKTYLNRTDNILDPLRFIMSNFSQVALAVLQFLFPALVVALIVQNVPAVQLALAKESSFLYGVYMVIFYFACMFLCVTGQVAIIGLYNGLKSAISNLEKVGKAG